MVAGLKSGLNPPAPNLEVNPANTTATHVGKFEQLLAVAPAGEYRQPPGLTLGCSTEHRLWFLRALGTKIVAGGGICSYHAENIPSRRDFFGLSWRATLG